MPRSKKRAAWGEAPWKIDFQVTPGDIPESVDFAIVGGGFTGLSAAAWLRHVDPGKSVALFEAESVGSGSSGHTGGMALSETAAGDLPGLGDVLGGLGSVVRALEVDCDLHLPGVWEIARKDGLAGSPISWTDGGTLRAVHEVPGGTLNPGKLLSGLARAATQRGALLFESARVDQLDLRGEQVLYVGKQRVRADRVLIATNAESLELSDLAGYAEPKFTLALATKELTEAQLEAMGLLSGKPFYTVDFPYLWGRLLDGNRVIFGSGLVHLADWRELETLDVREGEPAQLMASLERRVRGLHTAMRNVEFGHRWGGPILIAEGWRPVFGFHPKSERVIVSGAYSGHGVALSVHLGSWAAEAMLGRKDLPNWSVRGSTG